MYLSALYYCVKNQFLLQMTCRMSKHEMLNDMVEVETLFSLVSS